MYKTQVINSSEDSLEDCLEDCLDENDKLYPIAQKFLKDTNNNPTIDEIKNFIKKDMNGIVKDNECWFNLGNGWNNKLEIHDLFVD